MKSSDVTIVKTASVGIVKIPSPKTAKKSLVSPSLLHVNTRRNRKTESRWAKLKNFFASKSAVERDSIKLPEFPDLPNVPTSPKFSATVAAHRMPAKQNYGASSAGRFVPLRQLPDDPTLIQKITSTVIKLRGKDKFADLLPVEMLEIVPTGARRDFVESVIARNLTAEHAEIEKKYEARFIEPFAVDPPPTFHLLSHLEGAMNNRPGKRPTNEVDLLLACLPDQVIKSLDLSGLSAQNQQKYLRSILSAVSYKNGQTEWPPKFAAAIAEYQKTGRNLQAYVDGARQAQKLN